MSDPWPGSVLDFATPTPSRARNRVKALTASPEQNTIAENISPAMPMIGPRR
jgi:hypothetical protein